MRVSLVQEGETADIPASVVTSITQGAHTLSAMSMGMSVKILKPTRPSVWRADREAPLRNALCFGL